MPGAAAARASAPIAEGVAPGLTSPSTPDAGAGTGDAADARGRVPEVDDEVARGVLRAIGEGAGVRGGGVTSGQVPAADGGGGSAPVCESKRKPRSSPPASVMLDAPRSEFTHAPPARDRKSTQYEPELVKQPGG